MQLSLSEDQQQFIASYLLDCNIEQAFIRTGQTLEPCQPIKTTGYYVYALVDPANGEIFYIGKGINRRWEHHGNPKAKIDNGRKWLRVASIINRGETYKAYYLMRGLNSSQALVMERLFIRAIGAKRLTNVLLGSNDEHTTGLLKAMILYAQMAKHPDHPLAKKICGDMIGCIKMIVRQMQQNTGNKP